MPEILTIIPSRMNAKRLPGKPLLKIQGISIINHVYRRALEADIGEVYVATEDQEIFDSVTNNGGKCIIWKSMIRDRYWCKLYKKAIVRRKPYGYED